MELPRATIIRPLFHKAGIGLAAIGFVVVLIALCTHLLDVPARAPGTISSSEQYWEGFATMQRRLYAFLGGFGAFAFGSWLTTVCSSKKKV